MKAGHSAFSATDISTFEGTLLEQGAWIKRIKVEGARRVRSHMSDPDGNNVHVDFDLNA